MLNSIAIENFRCIENASLEFDPRSTGIVGDNASGKTSLLEAIYFLGHGRSFRTHQPDKLRRDDHGPEPGEQVAIALPGVDRGHYRLEGRGAVGFPGLGPSGRK